MDIMVKTLDERHAESERQLTKQAPCETEAEYRKAAETGSPEALFALAKALIDNSIEHQDPDEALLCLERIRNGAGKGAIPSEELAVVEKKVKQKQHELGEAQQLEYMHNQDA
jgi:multidrug resistance efflux pump